MGTWCVACRMADEDSLGPSRHVKMRTMQDMCSGWLILHKVHSTLKPASTAAVTHFVWQLNILCMLVCGKERCALSGCHVMHETMSMR